MSVQVKICGLSEPETVRAAVRAGADWIGFVFFETSPRNVSLAAAQRLMSALGEAVPVALLVDPDDALVRAVGELGFPVLQLHGRETPARLDEVKLLSGAQEIWKAVGIGAQADIDVLLAFTGHADRLLLDYKPPEAGILDHHLPGGAGEAFDWTLLSNWSAPCPWLLAGGLTPINVAGAIYATGARAVDVSSGVERMRGLKDARLIKSFIDAAKGASVNVPA